MEENDLSALNQISLLNFSPGYLLGSFIFGVIGFYMYRAGRKRASIQLTFCGVALMAYPIFISDTWVIWGVGAALSGLGYYYSNQHN